MNVWERPRVEPNPCRWHDDTVGCAIRFYCGDVDKELESETRNCDRDCPWFHEERKHGRKD